MSINIRKEKERMNEDILMLKEISDRLIAYDDVEIGTGNKIPLWLFGFLY